MLKQLFYPRDRSYNKKLLHDTVLENDVQLEYDDYFSYYVPFFLESRPLSIPMKVMPDITAEESWTTSEEQMKEFIAHVWDAVKRLTIQVPDSALSTFLDHVYRQHNIAYTYSLLDCWIRFDFAKNKPKINNVFTLLQLDSLKSDIHILISIDFYMLWPCPSCASLYFRGFKCLRFSSA